METLRLPTIEEALSAPALRSRREEARPAWSLETLAGRITEVSGGVASLSASAWILRASQKRGEPSAWIATSNSGFFPPDLADFGIDLAALPVVRAPNALAGARAAEHLLRSGAFGLVVFDLEDSGSSGAPLLPAAAVTRLAALTRRHHAALLCLSSSSAERNSLGPLVSLRCEGTVRKTASDPYRLELRILKDKRQGPGWSHEETCRGPDGLR